jgi:gliding motility-associated protein GldM
MTVYVDGENAEGVQKAKKEVKKGQVPCVPVAEIEGKDNFDKPTTFMLGSSDKPDPDKPAVKLKEELIKYHKNLMEFIQDKEGKPNAELLKQLDVLVPKPQYSEHEEKEVPWETYNFYHLITGGQVILLNKMISEVRSAEAAVLNYIIASAGSTNLSFAEYAGHSMAESKVLFAGDSYKTTVIVAAFDPNQKLDVYYQVGADSLSEANEANATHVDGPATGVNIEIPGGGVGQHKIAGYIKVKNENTGKVECYHFRDEYVVVPKGSATISADKMNVLYAGLKNPITIAGGSDASKLSVSFPGCSVSGSGQAREVVPPTSMIGKTVEATVTTSEGSSKMNFRVKKVPDPYAQIGANIYGGKKSKAELTANPMLIAKMSDDFAFDLKWTVQSYSVDVIEKGIITTINCSGSKFSQELINKINSASAGTVFMFSNIKITQAELGSRTMPRDITVRIK